MQLDDANRAIDAIWDLLVLPKLAEVTEGGAQVAYRFGLVGLELEERGEGDYGLLASLRRRGDQKKVHEAIRVLGQSERIPRGTVEAMSYDAPGDFVAMAIHPGSPVIRKNQIGQIDGPQGAFGAIVRLKSKGEDEKFLLSAEHILTNFGSDPQGGEIHWDDLASTGKGRTLLGRPFDTAGPDYDQPATEVRYDCGVAAMETDLGLPATRCFGPFARQPILARNGQDVRKCGPLAPHLTLGTVTNAFMSKAVVTFHTGLAGGRIVAIPFLGQVKIKAKAGTRFAQPGDSGAVVVLEGGDNEPVGLLFAGTQDGVWALANPMMEVKEQLAIESFVQRVDAGGPRVPSLASIGLSQGERDCVDPSRS